MNIQQHPDFAGRIAEAMQTLGGVDDATAARIDLAASHATSQMLAGHKLVVLGTPGVAALGELFCHGMLYRDADQRPALPAIALQGECRGSTSNSATQRRQDDKHNDNGQAIRQFLRAAEAVSAAGDSLLVLCDQHMPGMREALQQLYVSRGVSSIIIAPAESGRRADAQAHCIDISLECDTVAARQQLTLFILHTLADIIEARVFGTPDST